jgi:hypothetical protein
MMAPKVISFCMGPYCTCNSYDVYFRFLNIDQESTLERLKTEFVCGWLSDVCNSHFKVFVSCLLPHPPDYARVGGHW